MRAGLSVTLAEAACGGAATAVPARGVTATAAATISRVIKSLLPQLPGKTAQARYLRKVKLWLIQRRMNAVDFASLLCSRLCHDLMSPVGALNNGIELLADENDPDMRERCMELLADSARATANKLKFFRLAFGAAGGFGDAIDAREAKVALEGLFGAERRTELGWMVGEDRLSKGAMKLLLNLALLAGDALVRGGRLDVGAEKTGEGLELAIRAEGPRIMLDPSLKEVLLNGLSGDEHVEPRAAGAWLAHSLAAEAGGQIRLMEPSPEVLVIGALLPGHAASTSSGQD